MTPRECSFFDRPVHFGLGDAAHPSSERHGLAQHRARYGTEPRIRGKALHDRMRDCGLTGHGGAHFPVAVKWDAALADLGPGVLVVNAAEGEPASAKDAALLQLRPHLVLDGAAAAAERLGLAEVIVWLHDAPGDSLSGATRHSIEQAIAERAALGSSEPSMRVVSAPPAYVSGENSAVVRAIRGLLVDGVSAPAAPTTVADPARPWGDGPRIVVQNTETLARIALLAYGEWPLTTLVTIARAATAEQVDRTVVEVPRSALLAEVVESVAAGASTGPVLLGGYGGEWIPHTELTTLAMNQASARSLGHSLGAGVILLPPVEVPFVSFVAQLADYLAGESAGQCGPCIFGLRAIADRLGAASKTAKRMTAVPTDESLQRLLALVDGRGACKHPDSVVRMVRSALRLVSPAAVGSETASRPSGGATASTSVVRIDRSRCTGVGICARLAPAAISLDPWGYPLIDVESDTDIRQLQRAIRGCPRGALQLVPA